MLATRACAILVAAVVALAPQARAQQPDSNTIAPVRLDSVVVTILRTPFELTEVPFAVAVNGATEIRRAKPGLALDEALFAIPGVQVDNRYHYSLGERISIRGFGARAQFGVRGIKVIVDGIPATLPDGQTTLSHVNPGSLGSVQVIRGPASALYGNAAGGVIMFESADPPSIPLRQEIQLIGGGHGLRKLQSTTGGQSGPASYVFDLARFSYGGYREHSAAGKLFANARFGYRFAESDLRITANFVDYDALNPGALSDSLLAADRFQARQFNVIQQTGEERRQGQFGITWNRDLGPGQFELSAYGVTRRIDNPIPPFIVDLERKAGGARALYSFRSQLAGRDIQWTVGGEADLQRDDRENFTNESGERGDMILDQLETVRTFGTFAQVSLPLAERLKLMSGIRYDFFRFEAGDRLVTPENPDDSGSRTMDAISPTLGILYTAGDPLNLYANVATAFQTTTTTELVNRPSGGGGFNPALEPQRTLSFEVGAKGRIARRAIYQLAAYRANIENSLISFEVPDAPGRQFFRNAGSAVHQGVEAGAEIALFRGLVGRAAYTVHGCPIRVVQDRGGHLRRKSDPRGRAPPYRDEPHLRGTRRMVRGRSEPLCCRGPGQRRKQGVRTGVHRYELSRRARGRAVPKNRDRAVRGDHQRVQ